MLETKSPKDIRQSVTSIKDTIKDKSNKLCAAIYLVTNFLADLDQIKWRLRTKALDLKDKISAGDVLSIEIILSNVSEILSLIDIAVLDSRASAMNFLILRDGYRSLQQEFQNYVAGDWYRNLLLPKEATLPSHRQEATPAAAGMASNSVRRDKILNFIKQHNWSSATDIAKFIPDVGGKTIQRELAELVRTGTLKKQGERRWSRYNLTL